MASRADYIHNMAEQIRQRQQGTQSTYKPFNIQTSYGSRTVGEKEYNKMVQQRQKELAEEKKQKREDDMAARGITSPLLKARYNAFEDAKDYAAALNRKSLKSNLESGQFSVGQNALPTSPANIKLQKGLSQHTIDELGKKMENEQNIISNQGRDAESQEVKNAQKTLKDLEGRMAEAKKWQQSLPETGKLAPMAGFKATPSLTFLFWWIATLGMSARSRSIETSFVVRVPSSRITRRPATESGRSSQEAKIPPP